MVSRTKDLINQRKKYPRDTIWGISRGKDLSKEMSLYLFNLGNYVSKTLPLRSVGNTEDT